MILCSSNKEDSGPSRAMLCKDKILCFSFSAINPAIDFKLTSFDRNIVFAKSSLVLDKVFVQTRSSCHMSLNFNLTEQGKKIINSIKSSKGSKSSKQNVIYTAIKLSVSISIIKEDAKGVDYVKNSTMVGPFSNKNSNYYRCNSLLSPKLIEKYSQQMHRSTSKESSNQHQNFFKNSSWNMNSHHSSSKIDHAKKQLISSCSSQKDFNNLKKPKSNIQIDDADLNVKEPFKYIETMQSQFLDECNEFEENLHLNIDLLLDSLSQFETPEDYKSILSQFAANDVLKLALDHKNKTKRHINRGMVNALNKELPILEFTNLLLENIALSKGKLRTLQIESNRLSIKVNRIKRVKSDSHDILLSLVNSYEEANVVSMNETIKNTVEVQNDLNFLLSIVRRCLSSIDKVKFESLFSKSNSLIFDYLDEKFKVLPAAFQSREPQKQLEDDNDFNLALKDRPESQSGPISDPYNIQIANPNNFKTFEGNFEEDNISPI